MFWDLVYKSRRHDDHGSTHFFSPQRPANVNIHQCISFYFFFVTFFCNFFVHLLFFLFIECFLKLLARVSPYGDLFLWSTPTEESIDELNQIVLDNAYNLTTPEATNEIDFIRSVCAFINLWKFHVFLITNLRVKPTSVAVFTLTPLGTSYWRWTRLFDANHVR